MPSPVAFHIAVANTKSTNVDEVLDFVEAHTDDIISYGEEPAFVSKPRMDAFTCLAVLGAAGSVASLAALLWQAYDKFIASQKDRKSNAGLIISVTPTPGRPVQFWIGGTTKDRATFIADFTLEISQIQSMDANSEYARAVDQIMQTSERWVPRHR